MTDITEITQIILKERQGRDRGWFEQEAACFHEDSRVRITWFDGPGAEFVRMSSERYADGVQPIHRLSPPIVHVNEHRAIAEVPAEISVVQDFSGVPAYIVAYTRLLYRLESRDGRWKISQFDCIYERDTLVPVTYGATIDLDPDILDQFRPSYRYLGYHLHEIGLTVRQDLFGDDQPAEVAALYRDAFTWLLPSEVGPETSASTVRGAMA